MNKKLLEQVAALRNEVKDIEKRLQNNNINSVIADSVKGSSDSFPYTVCHKTIRGIDYKKQLKDSRYRKMLESKHEKITKLLIQIEYELNYIEDSEIRQIIRYKYFDDCSWIQIMHKMNYKSEEKARIKLKRFFEKN